MFAVIMLAVAALFAMLAVRIYRGKTELIHDYHQTKVTDKAGYGKAFGKAMGLMAAAMAASGAVSLFADPAWAVAVLFAGLAAGIACIVRVQKRFNGGVF